MRGCEDRLAASLTRKRLESGLVKRDRVALALIDNLTDAHPRYASHIRDAGMVFLDVSSSEAGSRRTRLTMEVAIEVSSRESQATPEEIYAYLAGVAERDLVLGICVQALLLLGVTTDAAFSPSGTRRKKRPAAEREAVARTLFELVKAFEAQEVVDDLERAFARPQPHPGANRSTRMLRRDAHLEGS